MELVTHRRSEMASESLAKLMEVISLQKAEGLR